MNIAQIAKMAGVSSAAVSRYFNNGYISEEKKEAIRQVVEKTGYRPSVQAQTLRTKKTKMIGIIIPKINSASISSVVAGIVSVLDENGYQPLLADTQNNPKKELSFLELFDEKQVDGLVFIATVFTAKHIKMLKNVKVPMVIVGQRLSGYSCVYHDDYHSFYDMTKMVLEKGRKKLGYLSAFHEDEAVGKERYRAFCDAVDDGGREELKERYRITAFHLHSGYEKAKELMTSYPDTDAIICATDEMAIGALQYLKEHEISVPDQVMVTGQGDNMMTKVTTPTITTIHYSYEESGISASKILLEMLTSGDDVPVREIKLGYSIVENESTKEIG